jgi:hypothetical protein
MAIIQVSITSSYKKLTRHLLQQVDVSSSYQELCDWHLKPCHVVVVHKLCLRDAHQHVCYCEWLLESVTEQLVDPLQYFMFHLSGYLNSQNSQYWATQNPYIVDKKPLTHVPSWKWTYRQKLQLLKGGNSSLYQSTAWDMLSNVWMWVDGTSSISYRWLIWVTFTCCTLCMHKFVTFII